MHVLEVLEMCMSLLTEGEEQSWKEEAGERADEMSEPWALFSITALITDIQPKPFSIQ